MKQQAGALLSSIAIDRDAPRKVSVQLYLALRDIILSGGLGPGDRLPASRILAREVGVSRTTVIDAIERLVAEGMLVSRVGAGTFVSDILEHQRPTPPVADTPGVPAPTPRLSHTIDHAFEAYAPRAQLPHSAGAFVTALPALDAFPVAHWARISARHLRGDRETIMGYGPPAGHPGLRRAIASHLNASRGIKCDPDQIFVTGGAQQAFSLIGRVLLNPGDGVWYENPGATGARNALIAAGADLVPVNVGAEGLDVEEGRAKAPHFRLAFVTPSHQQPLGHVMSLARRLELLEAANAAQALIIEDDYDGEFYYGDRPMPPLKSIDTEDRVLYVGTFSKTMFPSLRLGFVLVPRSLVTAFDRLFASWISTPPTATQASVAEFMDEGLFATHIRIMRRLYKARYQTLMEESPALPESIKVQPTTSGFHTTALLDGRVDVQLLINQARSAGVTIVPISRYALSPLGYNGLVLGFGSTGPDEIRAGIRVLREMPALRV
ncbi:PLP-dependent aminotransferase family protein [Pseudohalocynthiibacter aestuariivivens]|nr:PLP-dependent aminotransferase family protein [Pseudohalocynthiibacter aestuariivivens]QIE47120.1 PLP-dependent aminotransferase family protein [Pseudohalocynthiibacter aestuariivivens]